MTLARDKEIKRRLGNELKYPILNLISEIFKILGWVSILGIIFYIIIEGFDMFANFSGSNIEIVIILAGKLLLTFMIPLYLFFTSESIMLFMDIEKNTRK